MFERDGLPARLLAVILTIAMAWASSPVAGFGADASDAQGQEVASTGAAAKDADASSSQETASADTGGQSSATDPSSAGSTEDSAPDAADSGSTGSASDGSGSASAAVDAGSDNASDKSSKAVPERAPSAETEDTDSASGTYTFTAHWTNDADSETSYTNSDFNADDPDTWTDISCTANDNSQHKSTLYINLTAGGDSGTVYQPGEVKIYVPAGFYRGLDKDDPLLTACSDSNGQGSPLEQISWMIPKAPETDSVTDFNYVEETKEVDGQQVKYYVMQNAKELTGGIGLVVRIDYRFRPTMLDVKSVTQADGSDMGVYKARYPVTCEVSGKTIASKDLGVEVKTKVNPSTVTLTHATQDGNKGVYFAWNSAWGEKPADADQYFYVVWYATYKRGGGTTMPYTYKLEVDSDQTDGGELIGVKKYTGGAGPNGYEQGSVVLARMDSTYSGLSGNTDLLDTEWTGVSKSPTKTNTYNGNMISSLSMGTGSLWQYQVFALLVKYPVRKIQDAVASGTDMTNTGIQPKFGVKVTETWQDGTVVEKPPVGPSGDYSVKALPAGGGSRDLSKRRGQSPYYAAHTEKALQSILSQNHDVTIDDYVLSSYNYSDKATWDSTNKSYSATTGFDIKDGKYYLFTASPSYYGKVAGADSISKNDPLELTDSEYSLTSFYMDDVEYDGYYMDGIGWQRDVSESADYGSYQPVEIWVRKQGEDAMSLFGTIQRTSKSGYTFISADGTKLENVNSRNRVSFPEGTVQVEVKQTDSKHYASSVQLRYGLTLHPDETVIARLHKDINAGKASAVGGFASGSQSVEGTDISNSGETLGGYWHVVTYELSPIGSGVDMSINPNGRYTDDASKSERSVPIIVDMYNGTNVYQESLPQYANAEYMRSYIPRSGEFYVLLPAGTYVDRDEVVAGVRTSFTTCNPVTRTVDLIQNWENSGRTMMKVSVSIEDSQLMYYNYWSGIMLKYTLHDTYTNIVDRGGLVTNSVMFVNTTGKTSGEESIFNSNLKAHADAKIDGWSLYKSAAESAWNDGCQVQVAQSKFDFGEITAKQTGFSTKVETDNDPTYQLTGTAYVGDRYTDRMQYTALDETRSTDLILYDVFSPDTSNAVGSFESIDVSSIDAKPTYDAAANKTIEDTCKPVVWYATAMPADKATSPSLDDASWNWTETEPDDLSTIKAVAIDCRKTDKGNDFVLDKGGTIVAYVGLKASEDATLAGRTEKNGASISAITFNGTEPAKSDTSTTLTSSRAVELLAPHLSITKTSDPASGTKEHPAEIGNSADMKLTYTITVKNNAEDASLPDVNVVHVADALPEGLELGGGGEAITVQSDSLGIKEPAAIGKQNAVSCKNEDGDLSFDISHLPSGASVTITVPAIRKDPVGSTTMYTNTAMIETVGGSRVGYMPDPDRGDNSSSSTYHKTTVTSLPLAGGSGFGGLVAVGCALVGVSAVAWIRRRRKA